MRATTLSILTLLLLACSSPPLVAKTHYLLRSGQETGVGAVRSDSRVGLRRTMVAPYLSHLGLALETAPNEVHAARMHLWAEPLDRALLIFLRSAISSSYGEAIGYRATEDTQWERSIDVFVEQLHGTMQGSALLVATYRIRGPGEAIVEYRFSSRRVLPREGYDGLVEAERQLLDELGAAIATSLRETR